MRVVRLSRNMSLSCEFGACGTGPGSFQAGAAAPVIAAPICAIAEPCGAIVLGAAIGLTAIEGALIVAQHHKTVDNDRINDCYTDYLQETNQCRRINNPQRAQSCWRQASERLAACQSGRIKPPFNF